MQSKFVGERVQVVVEGKVVECRRSLDFLDGWIVDLN